MRAEVPAGELPPLQSLSRRPWSTFVWGPSRPVTLRLLYTLARANDPKFFWCEIRRPGEGPAEPGPVELGWIPPHRLFLSVPLASRPQTEPDAAVVRKLIRSDEPFETVRQLLSFLQLPPIAQEIVTEVGGPEVKRVFALAHAERIREYFPKTPEGIRGLIDAMCSNGVLPFFGAIGPVTPARMLCDFVFEVRAPDLAHVAEGRLICEKAPAGAAFRAGAEFSLDSAPAFHRSFST
ncbi:MAG: hypothetical protein L3K15_08715 [Thermoplasmata archaeon]|nr:hypothetical protein [Thermoplasmata archaeon]